MGLYIAHPSSLEHDTGAHPENASRLEAVEATLERAGWPGLKRVEAPVATIEQLRRVHTEEHIRRIEELSSLGGGMIDADTVASERSFEAARHAAGGPTRAVDRMLAGEERFAFCGLRPPGHHAEAARAMGFCLFNNVAVAAAHALAEGEVERVLVLDWDVHHGNGTEAIFAESDRVLYASIHQWPLYPGTGDADYAGEGEGEGYTVNLPVPPGSGSEDFLSLVQHVVAPIARSFEPGLIARLDSEAFGEMAATMRAVAAELGVPVLVCLEGGYEPAALAASVLSTIEGLASDREPARAPAEPAQPHIERQRRHWPSI